MTQADDLVKTRKAQADRELVTKFIGSTEAYEKALELGFQTSFITEPGALRAMVVVEKFYNDNGRTVPSIDYIKDKAIPFLPAPNEEQVVQTFIRVKELHVTVKLRTAADHAIAAVLSDPAAASSRLAEQSRDIAAIATTSSQTFSLKELAEMELAEYEIRAQNGIGLALPYAWPGLTRLTMGKRQGQMQYFYGLQKNYKSTLLLYDAYYTAAVERRRTYVASGELSPREIIQMLLAHHGKACLDRMRRGALTMEEQVRYREAAVTLNDLPIEVGQQSRPGLTELDLIASRAERFKADVVYLDGAHRLPASLEYEDIAAYAQRVKTHAVGLNVPWVCAVQAARHGRKKGVSADKNNVDSSEADTGGSIAWGQECAAAIRCVKIQHGLARMEVADARFGESGSVDTIVMPGINMGQQM